MGTLLPLAQGIAAADRITTVSPTHTDEIQTPDYGFGLDTFLAARLPGCAASSTASTRRRGTRGAIRPLALTTIPARRGSPPEQGGAAATLGLPVEPRIPLLGMVTRLDVQKGVDLALGALTRLADSAWQLVLLGSGDPAIEDRAREFAATGATGPRPFRACLRPRGCHAGSSPERMWSWSPSRYEPCGLVQLIALRYGAVPLVRATGGLKDTVAPMRSVGKGRLLVRHRGGTGTGETRSRTALEVYSDQRRWLGSAASGNGAGLHLGSFGSSLCEICTRRRLRSAVRGGEARRESGPGGGDLLHPTSLPGPHGIGDLGPAAHSWVAGWRAPAADFGKCCPSARPVMADSPYQSFSASPEIRC